MRYLLPCLLFPLPALADPSMECADAASQVEIGACVSDMETRVDAALSTALGFAMSSARELDEITARSVAVPALEASQSAWEAYRAAHSDYIGSTFGGGSGTGIAITSWRVVLGRARVEALMAQAR